LNTGFSKYHALGNTYIVLPGLPEVPPAALIQQICDVHYGIGSDGILLPVPPPEPAPGGLPAFGLRIFNPDGSEAEKSGNGLRIFSRWLYDQGQVQEASFAVWTAGGWVQARVAPGGSPITVEMGGFSFDSARIPMLGAPRLVIDEALPVGDETLRICAVSLGNPHCVVLDAPTDEASARRLGPLIENHPAFPRRINVQFLHVLDRQNLAIHIWERGAGYTLASGSSSCAAAAAAHRLGLADAAVTVHCPGGALSVHIHPDDTLTLTGPVTPIAQGTIIY
jgi:diaminopimelate epimerase